MKSKFNLLKRNINILSFSSISFIFAIILGVGSVTGINSYKNNLKNTIIKESRKMMGSDLSFESSQNFSETITQEIQQALPPGYKHVKTIQLSTMLGILKTGDSTLSMIKAIETNYPFYGEILTNPPDAITNLQSDQILLDETLVVNYKIQLGDMVKIGETKFKYAGAIQKEPLSGMGGFSGMAPTSIIKMEGLIETGLERKGSRVKYSIHVSLPDDNNSFDIKSSIFYQFAKKDITVLHHTEVGSGTQKFIYNTLDFMSLLGLSAFFLGSVSILISVRTRLQNKIKEIAIFKCLGATSLFTIKIFVIEILFLSLLGSTLGVLSGYLIQFLIPDITGSEFLRRIEPGLDTKSFIWGLIIGILVPISLTFDSILKILNQSPINALRSELDESVNLNVNSKFANIFQVLIIYLLFFFIAYLETEKISKALLLSIVLVLLPLFIYIFYIGLRKIGKYFSETYIFSGTTRFTVSKLSKAGNGLSLPIVGIGSALSILLITIFMRYNLNILSGWRFDKARANVFVMDIKPDQKDQFDSILNSHSIYEKYTSSMIGARLSRINSIPVNKEEQDINALNRDWKSTAKTREYFLSVREKLYDTEEIISGKFWDSDGINEISIEKDFAKSLGVGVGDTLEFNVQGIEVSGKISNLREVNWADMKPNFVVIFSKGELDNAPSNFISSFYIENKDERYELQKRLSREIPGIVVFDIEKTISALNSIFSKINSIINLMTYFIISSSLLLLLSALYLQEKERKRKLHFIR